jgi:hypothetical protein
LSFVITQKKDVRKNFETYMVLTDEVPEQLAALVGFLQHVRPPPTRIAHHLHMPHTIHSSVGKIA